MRERAREKKREGGREGEREDREGGRKRGRKGREGGRERFNHIKMNKPEASIVSVKPNSILAINVINEGPNE